MKTPIFANRFKMGAVAMAVLVASVVQGCAVKPIAPENRAGWVPPPGTSITLKRALNIVANQAEVYIQNGQVHERIRGIDIYLPYCAFTVVRNRDAMTRSFAVDQGHFRVDRAWRAVDYSALSSGETVVVAAASNSRNPLWIPHDNERPLETLATNMRLSSLDQPEVSMLKCAIFADYFHFNFLSLNDIRDTLGEVAEIQLR